VRSSYGAGSRANICPKGLACRDECKRVHEGRRPGLCRNGKGCSRLDCWYTHPVMKAADICPKALLCRGECKLLHPRRRRGECRDGEYCDKIGRCLYSHPLPSPCYFGFECSSKKTCERKHESKEEYYLRLAKERPALAFATTFTRASVDNSIDSEHNMVRHKCYCARCHERMVGSNLWCSDQCGGFTSSCRQGKGMYNGTHGERGASGCYHEHSRCNMPGCERQCDTNGDDYSLVAHPFCKHHAPKCACGLPAFTQESSAVYVTPNEAELASMTASYEAKCIRCYNYERTRCNMPHCEKLRISKNNLRKAHAFCKDHARKCICGKPTHTNKDWTSMANPTQLELDEMKLSYYAKCDNCCSVPECKMERAFYQWPFCTVHAPKCHCGAPTHIVDGWTKGNFAFPVHSPADLDAMITSYDAKCRRCLDEFMKTTVFGTSRPSRIKCHLSSCPRPVQVIYRPLHTRVFDQVKKRYVVITENKWLPQIACDHCAPKCGCGQPCLSHNDKHKGYFPECCGCLELKAKPGAASTSPFVQTQMNLTFGPYRLF